MKKILVRADDLGYSEAFNYGLARAVKSGIVRCVGVMPNMEWAEHGVNLLKDTDVTFTVHANICQGRPITDPAISPLWWMKTASSRTRACTGKPRKISWYWKKWSWKWKPSTSVWWN